MSPRRLALATRKGLLILSPHTGGWTVSHEAFAGSHVSIVHLDPRSGHLYACLDDGHFGNKLFRWSGFLKDSNWAAADPKQVWSEIPAPKYPDGSKLVNGRDAVLLYQWAMANGSESQPGRIYLGTEPGGLFTSDDHGDSFQLVSGLWEHPSRIDEGNPWFGGGRDNPGIHSVCVDPRDADQIRVGISCAGVFGTGDGGQTWRPMNRGLRADFLPNPAAETGHDPHLLVQVGSRPDVLWQQNHCGVFRSTDGGENWNDISAEDGLPGFGFAVAVDHDDPEVAWVVPAESDMVRAAVKRRLCVCRTEDGGQNWQAFTAGLPQQDCFDFAFRHCLIHEAGRLVLGTACGSLYWSQDRGESWQSLNSHLPPIYCVASV